MSNENDDVSEAKGCLFYVLAFAVLVFTLKYGCN
jgi:hypothetical protein